MIVLAELAVRTRAPAAGAVGAAAGSHRTHPLSIAGRASSQTRPVLRGGGDRAPRAGARPVAARRLTLRNCLAGPPSPTKFVAPAIGAAATLLPWRRAARWHSHCTSSLRA